MISEPQKRISKKALSVWRISGAFSSGFFMLIATAVTVATFLFEWTLWIMIASVILATLYTFLFVFLIPSLRWKRWRYELRENEIELQYGVFITVRTLIPMVRVQHVDTVQGPILRKYNLATVAISTAATIHEIPALDMEEAEGLRQSISRLARVADEDV